MTFLIFEGRSQFWGAKFIALFLSALASAPLAKKEKKIILTKELIQESFFLNFFNRGVAQPG
ncbi:MAG: hypothetical protein IJH67_06050 [Thermoguttaceae bacterium]|nr:hypothetical protein [Thermoguttaceae bacterium]